MNPTEPEIIIAKIKSHKGQIVLRGFSDNSPEQFWLVNFNGTELELWWQNRDQFWWEITPESREDPLAAVFGCAPPPLCSPMQLPGEFLPSQFEHHGEDDPLSSYWQSLYETKRGYYCQICCDGDPFLRTPDGRRILHKGYPSLPAESH
jgi:hypothetical protein